MMENSIAIGSSWIKEINMDAMKMRPALIGFLDKAQDLNIEFLKTPSGDLTGIYNGKYIYSTINPRKQVREQINRSNFQKKGLILVMGLGLGYLVEELLNMIKPHQMILIVDKDFSIMKAALSFKRFDRIIKDPRVQMALSGDMGENIDAILKPFMNKIEFEGLEVFMDPASKIVHPDTYSAFKEKLISSLRTANVGELTNYIQMFRFTNNEILNTPYYVSSPGIDVLKDLIKDMPALVVSGGPSLNKNIDLIHKLKNKALIIALGTTLKPLLKHGIIPDIVIAIDPAPLQVKYFDNIDIPKEIFFVTTNVFNPRALTYWRGPSFWINDGTSYVRFLDTISNYHRPSIYLGMTVAHGATSLAYYMGANPVILVGQDLSYTSNKTHVDGAAFSKEIDITKSKEVIWVPGNYEDKVPTLRNFVAYIKLFENMAHSFKKKREDFLLINATEGGAKINGTEVMRLQDVIDNYLPDKDTIFISLLREAYLSKDIDISVDEMSHKMGGKILEFRKMREDFALILKMAKRIDPDAKKIDFKYIETYNKKIREVHKEIDNMEAFEFMERFTRAFNIIKEIREYKSKDVADVRKKLKIQMEKSVNFYTTLYTIALYFEQLFLYVKNHRLKIINRILYERSKDFNLTTD